MLTENHFNMEENYLIEKKVEFYQQQLKIMASGIPKKYRQRMTNELLLELAHCLCNEINFEIVTGLMDIQHVTEKYLYQLRLKIVSNQENELARALENAPLGKEASIKNTMAIRHRNQLRQVDRKLVQTLDSKVSEQQETLEKAGFPGFYKTLNPVEVKVQMFLLDFILRLSKAQVPSESQ